MKNESSSELKLRLRRQAERTLSRNEATAQLQQASEEQQQTIYELRVHQIELEMQNEELRRIQHELETSRERYRDLYDQAPVGYLTMNEQGIILEANLTAAQLLGTARDSLLHRPLSTYISSDNQDCYYLLQKSLFDTKEPQTLDIVMLRSDGATFQAHLQAAPSHSGEFRITLDDITEIWHARQELL